MTIISIEERRRERALVQHRACLKDPRNRARLILFIEELRRRREYEEATRRG